MAFFSDYLPTGTEVDADAIEQAFIAAQRSQGRELYPHQAEALLAIAAEEHVIAATPTGSGKSTIGYAAIFAALARQQRAVYTAPIKALVSEKFFELIDLFGAQNVGMATGDSVVNADAPILVCTAEILAQRALGDGDASNVDVVVMDEFHYYGDSSRGWAWQVPLLEIPSAQFILMSATLGDVSFFVKDLQMRSKRAVSVIADAPRPVPLEFEWSNTYLPQTIENLLKKQDAPIYIVHSTQAAAMEQALALKDLKLLSADEKEKLKEIIGDFRFSKGFGQTLSRLVRGGVGIHHAGMLPKYRRLVEKLAQSGLLKLICGTDTLGVGINVPIRTVLITKLVKFDGKRQRLLSAREFHQIAGRAGRAGFDTLGHVVVQAPEWQIEFEEKQARKLAQDKSGAHTTPNNAKKKKKPLQVKVPDGELNWTKAQFEKLVEKQPEALNGHLRMTYSMMLNLITRPGELVHNVSTLIYGSHQTPTQQRALARTAISLYKSLKQAELVSVLDKPDRFGRYVVLHPDLQLDFALNQPLSPFAIAALDLLDADDPKFALDALSIIEAILEDPMPVLLAQQNKERARVNAELKADGLDFYERKQQVEEITWPMPLREELENAFEIYAKTNPWVSRGDLRPKSIAREIFESGMTFSEFISRYKLHRSEGIVLRYLSDVYRTLRASIPQEKRDLALEEIIEWLGVLIRGVDSSLLDEWESLIHPDPESDDPAEALRSTTPRTLSSQEGVLKTMVRQAMWQRVEHFAFEREEELAELDGEAGFDLDAWADAMDEFYDLYDHVEITGEARSTHLLKIVPEGRKWLIRQTIDDPEHNRDFVLDAEVDLDETDEIGELALKLLHVGLIDNSPLNLMP